MKCARMVAPALPCHRKSALTSVASCAATESGSGVVRRPKISSGRVGAPSIRGTRRWCSPPRSRCRAPPRRDRTNPAATPREDARRGCPRRTGSRIGSHARAARVREPRVRTRHSAADHSQLGAFAGGAKRGGLLGVSGEVALDVRHFRDAVERTRLGVDELPRLREQIGDEQRVVVVERVLPVDVEVGVLAEHDHALGVERDAEPLAQRALRRCHVGRRPRRVRARTCEHCARRGPQAQKNTAERSRHDAHGTRTS